MILKRDGSFPWDGVSFDCFACHAVFTPEAHDTKGRKPRKDRSGTWWWYVSCPYCNAVGDMEQAKEEACTSTG